ncbi:MAG: serine protease [Candidatus Zambryskibacteria bacterium]|nr:serine protease [Candidatus Zambryskibacteria bacterium]
MTKKTLILFLSICVFVFCLWSLQTPPKSQNKSTETAINATSTGQTIIQKTIATTTENNKKVVTEPKPVISQKPKASIPVVTEQKITEPTPNFELINTFARQATVNILCIVKNNNLSPISGTGIIINSDGLILTNAHIAQYFLLRDLYQKDFIDCVIRTGSPAYPKYHAELVYISPTWVENNKTEIKLENPQGTGEKDYAFLRITDVIDGSSLPNFSYIPVSIREKIDINEPVVLVSYPAGFLGGLSIIQNLYITSAITNIQNIFTFGENTVDVIAVGGTVVSQKGASGGAVVDKNSSLIGIISTSSNGNTTSNRELNAITLAYINRNLQSEIGLTLPEFLSQDLASFAKTFQETTAVNLTKILTDEIIKNQ